MDCTQSKDFCASLRVSSIKTRIKTYILRAVSVKPGNSESIFH